MFCFFFLLNVPLLRDAQAVVRDADDELHPGPPLTLAFVRPPPPVRTIPARADSCISAASRRFFTGERRRETAAAADGGRLTCCFPPEGGSGPRVVTATRAPRCDLSLWLCHPPLGRKEKLKIKSSQVHTSPFKASQPLARERKRRNSDANEKSNKQKSEFVL